MIYVNQNLFIAWLQQQVKFVWGNGIQFTDFKIKYTISVKVE